MFRYFLNGYSQKLFFEQITFKLNFFFKILFALDKSTMQYNKFYKKLIIPTSFFLIKKDEIINYSRKANILLSKAIKKLSTTQLINNRYYTYDNMNDTSLHKNLMIVLGLPPYPYLNAICNADVVKMYNYEKS